MEEDPPRARPAGGWNMTVWLCLRVLIARALAWIPLMVFVSDLESILAAKGLLPGSALDAAPARLTLLAVLGALLLAADVAAPLVWVWPIGRYLDTEEPARRERALSRFNRLNRFFVALYAVMLAAALATATRGRFAGSLVLDAFTAYYGVYFTLLALEPLLFKDLARWLYSGEELFEPKSGPMLTVRAKLLLLVLNLIVIPMTLVGVSMTLGLTGWSQGLGVAVMTAVFAVGSTEMLYQGLAYPLAELNAKMARVSRGDFSAKTSVLADDEVGRLKRHYNEMVDGLAERERLKDTFGRFVSVEIAKRLIETNALALGGESIEATVLFSDIRDFTPLSESLPPQELVALLNRYFSFVTEPISRHHGVVNKFIGDAVMAIFAPQFGSADHAADAVRAAREMRVKLAEFNASRPGAAPLRFGVGVHTGLLVAGNIGTEKRMEYTVIGDTVNAAARIESKTKDFGTDLLISASVHARLPPEDRGGAERLEGVKVKGKDETLVLYTLA